MSLPGSILLVMSAAYLGIFAQQFAEDGLCLCFCLRLECTAVLRQVRGASAGGGDHGR